MGKGAMEFCPVIPRTRYLTFGYHLRVEQLIRNPNRRFPPLFVRDSKRSLNCKERKESGAAELPPKEIERILTTNER